MTLLIALLLLNNMEAPTILYVATVVVWFAHLYFHMHPDEFEQD